MNHEKIIVELELDEILPNRFQPRFKFHEQAITELAESIKEHGVIQPILVRRNEDKYEIIAGERRYKASLLAGKRTIPAIVADLNDKDSAEVALIENVQRQDLTPIEEAVSYRKILDMGYLTQEQLAEKLGKTQSTISNKLRLLNLADEVQDSLLDEKISERHARSLLKIESKQKQKEILEKIIKDRLTVKKTDELIENILLNSTDSTDTEKFVPNIFMNNSVQMEEPAIQSSSAIEFIDPNNQIVNSFSNNNSKDEELLDFLNVDNNIPEQKIVPVEELNETPIIQDINLDSNVENMSENMSDVPENIETINYSKFEIPSSPIVEEIEDVANQPFQVQDNEQELKEINDMINNIPNQINPGFVDVDNIEKNAQDIYVEKPLADIDNLLMSSNSDSSDIITNFNQESEQIKEENEPVQQNKFFTMFTPEDTEENSDEEPAEEETFNFTPKVETDQSLNQFLNDNNDEEIKSDENKQTDQNDYSSFSFDNNFEQNADLNSFESNEKKDDDSIQTSNLNLNEFYDVQDKIEEIDDEPKTINYPADNNLAESIKKEEVIEEKTVDNNIYAVADLKTVINTIRNCADTIEKYGFALECEEYDFEDMYQVIFKIQKNDK